MCEMIYLVDLGKRLLDQRVVSFTLALAEQYCTCYAVQLHRWVLRLFICGGGR